MNTETIKRAIAFYECSPTGQYDDEAVEALRALLALKPEPPRDQFEVFALEIATGAYTPEQAQARARLLTAGWPLVPPCQYPRPCCPKDGK